MGGVMAKDRRPAEELSVEELEAILARKKLEARQARIQRFRQSGRALPLQPDPVAISYVDDSIGGTAFEESDPGQAGSTRKRRLPAAFDGVLLFLEVGAVLGLALVLLSGFKALRQLNQEAAAAMEEPTAVATPLITAVVLPSGHTPPGSPGGAAPNDAEIPSNLRPLVQSLPPVAIPTAGPEQANSIFIPAIWNAPAPVVQGDGWEQLRKGVGQHVGTANPGQVGNLVLSAHNDIFGELFRDLEELKPGDEIRVSTATREFIYRVTDTQIVQPTEVSVMDATSRPTITLVSCYPYLVDNQRIVVQGELVEG
jgi:sortase A